MRIGLNTSAFGSVEVRTVVRANEVGVAIGNEKGDLRSLLANELPGIANALQQQNLKLNPVSFHQGFGSSMDLSSGADSSQSFAPRPPMLPTLAADERDGETTERTESLPVSGNGRLSILA